MQQKWWVTWFCGYLWWFLRWVCGDGGGFFFLFLFFNQSSSGLVVIMAMGGYGWWLGWVGGCDVEVVGLWFGFGRKFQFVEVMGGNGGNKLGGGYWFAGFVHGCSSFKERERETGKERDERKEKE